MRTPCFPAPVRQVVVGLGNKDPERGDKDQERRPEAADPAGGCGTPGPRPPPPATSPASPVASGAPALFYILCRRPGPAALTTALQTCLSDA